jgi:hypothetical protein
VLVIGTKSHDGLSKQSVSGCPSIRDANPWLDIRATRPVWAHASRRAIGCEVGPVAWIHCATGCANDAVVNAIDRSRFRAMILPEVTDLLILPLYSTMLTGEHSLLT